MRAAGNWTVWRYHRKGQLKKDSLGKAAVFRKLFDSLEDSEERKAKAERWYSETLEDLLQVAA